MMRWGNREERYRDDGKDKADPEESGNKIMAYLDRIADGLFL